MMPTNELRTCAEAVGDAPDPSPPQAFFCGMLDVSKSQDHRPASRSLKGRGFRLLPEMSLRTRLPTTTAQLRSGTMATHGSERPIETDFRTRRRKQTAAHVRLSRP